MKKYAVIVAAGSGTRMGHPIPKQFLLLHGHPVLWHTLKAFITAFQDIHFIVVLPKAYVTQGETILQSLQLHNYIITEGGENRFYSVQNGLKLVPKESVVFVHDGVRCLVSSTLIRECCKQALKKGSAIPAVPTTDTVRWEEPDGTHHILDRRQVRLIQTPQTFLSRILLPAFQQPYREEFTDEAVVVEYSGEQVHLIEGEQSNIKITTPLDLIFAEQIIKQRSLTANASTNAKE
jgi:2-C-methyl-D-erythritol 4-phosphate cytidylyltransferase